MDIPSMNRSTSFENVMRSNSKSSIALTRPIPVDLLVVSAVAASWALSMIVLWREASNSDRTASRSTNCTDNGQS